jgi:hypothetical protein
MVGGDRHTTVLWWVQLALKRLADSGDVTDQAVQSLSSAISTMRGQANDLMSSLDRDAPLPYLNLAGFLVQANLFLMTTWKGLMWSSWFNALGGGMFAQPKLYADIATLFLWNLSYKAMYDLAYHLRNPFTHRSIDVAHETIGSGLRKLAAALMEANPHIPATMVGATARVVKSQPTSV